MKAFLPLALLAVGAAPVDHPRTYLLSIGRIPLRETESIEAFAIRTWGVQFKSVCRIPEGWRVRAGSGATASGELVGEGSEGTTWFNHGTPKELHAFILVSMVAPVQRYDVGSPNNGIPATFKGSVTINTDDGEVKRALTYKNVTLTPARNCPNR